MIRYYIFLLFFLYQTEYSQTFRFGGTFNLSLPVNENIGWQYGPQIKIGSSFSSLPVFMDANFRYYWGDQITDIPMMNYGASVSYLFPGCFNTKPYFSAGVFRNSYDTKGFYHHFVIHEMTDNFSIELGLGILIPAEGKTNWNIELAYNFNKPSARFYDFYSGLDNERYLNLNCLYIKFGFVFN